MLFFCRLMMILLLSSSLSSVIIIVIIIINITIIIIIDYRQYCFFMTTVSIFMAIHRWYYFQDCLFLHLAFKRERFLWLTTNRQAGRQSRLWASSACQLGPSLTHQGCVYVLGGGGGADTPSFCSHSSLIVMSFGTRLSVVMFFSSFFSFFSSFFHY